MLEIQRLTYNYIMLLTRGICWLIYSRWSYWVSTQIYKILKVSWCNVWQYGRMMPSSPTRDSLQFQLHSLSITHSPNIWVKISCWHFSLTPIILPSILQETSKKVIFVIFLFVESRQACFNFDCLSQRMLIIFCTFGLTTKV